MLAFQARLILCKNHHFSFEIWWFFYAHKVHCSKLLTLIFGKCFSLPPLKKTVTIQVSQKKGAVFL